MHSPTCDDPASAKRRIEQEMAKIQSETKQSRVQKMKELVGEQASPIKDRKGSYATKLEEWEARGREHLEGDDGGAAILGPPPLSSSSASNSPIKEYKALAAANAAKTISGVDAPSLFAHDPVRYANDRVAAARRAEAESSDQPTPSPSLPNPLAPRDWDGVTTYSLVDLRQRRVPVDIDWKNREQYLSDDEFFRAFQMSKHDFAAQPKWKRDKLKQGLYLF